MLSARSDVPHGRQVARALQLRLNARRLEFSLISAAGDAGSVRVGIELGEGARFLAANVRVVADGHQAHATSGSGEAEAKRVWKNELVSTC